MVVLKFSGTLDKEGMGKSPPLGSVMGSTWQQYLLGPYESQHKPVLYNVTMKNPSLLLAGLDGLGATSYLLGSVCKSNCRHF